MTPYLQFDRNQWAALRDSVPMTLSEDEIARLKGINEDLSLEEVAEIYLPLSRLLNFYIARICAVRQFWNSFLVPTGNAFLTLSVLLAVSRWGKVQPPVYCRRY